MLAMASTAAAVLGPLLVSVLLAAAGAAAAAATWTASRKGTLRAAPRGEEE